MKVGYLIFGGAALAKKYKIGATFGTAAVPACHAWTTPDNGIRPMQGVTVATDYLGVTTDTATYSETQGDADALITVVVNPDAVLKARMCDSATSGTQLDIITNSVAETAGTTATITAGEDAPNSPDLAQGAMACISGANTGQFRKLITTAATTAACTKPFGNDILAGDIFVLVPWWEQAGASSGDNVQLTTDLTEARADIATGTGIESLIWDLRFDFSGASNARRDSYLYFQPNDHVAYLNT